jgi:hypothetical protein
MIYFVQGTITKNIKIGFTEDFDRRFHKDLRSSDLLVCLNLIDGEPGEEATLHHRFEKHASHHEWFYPAPELLEYINSLPESKYTGLVQDLKTSFEKTYEGRLDEYRQKQQIASVQGAVHSGQTKDEWRVMVTFQCPLCLKRHRIKQQGKGLMPKVFVVECLNKQGIIEVSPYR